MRKPAFCLCENKAQISFAVFAMLIRAFAFAPRMVQCLFFLNLKFQAYNHLLWLYRPVCIRPGQIPQRPVFSRQGSNGLANIVMIMKNIGVFWIKFRLNML